MIKLHAADCAVMAIILTPCPGRFVFTETEHFTCTYLLRFPVNRPGWRYDWSGAPEV